MPTLSVIIYSFMAAWEFFKQNWQSFLTIIGAMAGIVVIITFWSEKISPRLHRFYEWIKSKMPKFARREELETIKGEIDNLKNGINAMKFKPEIKEFSQEEKQKLAISCNPDFGFVFPRNFKFNFEIDNRFNQSFLLDRILYKAHAGYIKEEKWYHICEDALLLRVVIEGNNKTTISKLSLVAKPDSIDIINEELIGRERDIKWLIFIVAFFEGQEGLKVWSNEISAITKYSDWKTWNTWWNAYGN